MQISIEEDIIQTRARERYAIEFKFENTNYDVDRCLNTLEKLILEV
ncbi:MAG: hypothetical protein ACK5LT_11050 [Lachnospirales bacterium]